MDMAYPLHGTPAAKADPDDSKLEDDNVTTMLAAVTA
jgi:hypothetical protein